MIVSDNVPEVDFEEMKYQFTLMDVVDLAVRYGYQRVMEDLQRLLYDDPRLHNGDADE